MKSRTEIEILRRRADDQRNAEEHFYQAPTSLDADSSTILATCVSTSTITPSTSPSPPGTYGSGTATLDVESGTGYTAGASVTILNRFPVSWPSGDLFVVRSNDGGVTWHVVEHYCP